MYGYLLQDWITIRATSGATPAPVIQNESDWVGFSSFQDIVFWVDIREWSSSSGNVTMSLQTSPTKDEALFQTISNCSFTLAVTTPYLSGGALPKAILALNPGVPLATWVRWSLIGASSATWDCTFRVLASANRVANT